MDVSGPSSCQVWNFQSSAPGMPKPETLHSLMLFAVSQRLDPQRPCQASADAVLRERLSGVRHDTTSAEAKALGYKADYAISRLLGKWLRNHDESCSSLPRRPQSQGRLFTHFRLHRQVLRWFRLGSLMCLSEGATLAFAPKGLNIPQLARIKIAKHLQFPKNPDRLGHVHSESL